MTLHPDVAAEIQKLAPSAIVELYEVDLTALGDTVYYFHGGTNNLRQNVVWQGQTYMPWPVTASGFDYSGTGQLPRPKMMLSNKLGTITALLLSLNDCLGGKVTRRRTLVRFLDAVNFPGGINDDADPTAHLPEDVFFIDRKAREDFEAVEFELTAPYDVTGVKLPRRQIIRDLCPFKYRGAECGYAGDSYFDKNDAPVVDASADVCGKRLSSCKCRFGANSPLSFGGFPGSGDVS